ncbi:uncharacterized protein CMU_042780 [Cryptosporidium muris RN66]|uniref:Uncharacterized protein n=1 Tax=Cryptosporidium muris (strain RN66) TaxID=441375 RepID=B6AAG3_CRYMR|nr:uncharacterized protein CMU_042780 [Cryptosporidium muris RN66]EEA05204.1 hypothetical protein CMU_042780 [Cryptosporidium muris RN66]|eukprot:XP_002139553.1 hypothetical protein [Cryptosporidium muris RN66]
MFSRKSNSKFIESIEYPNFENISNVNSELDLLPQSAITNNIEEIKYCNSSSCSDEDSSDNEDNGYPKQNINIIWPSKSEITDKRYKVEDRTSNQLNVCKLNSTDDIKIKTIAEYRQYVKPKYTTQSEIAKIKTENLNKLLTSPEYIHKKKNEIEFYIVQVALLPGFASKHFNIYNNLKLNLRLVNDTNNERLVYLHRLESEHTGISKHFARKLCNIYNKRYFNNFIDSYSIKLICNDIIFLPVSILNEVRRTCKYSIYIEDNKDIVAVCNFELDIEKNKTSNTQLVIVGKEKVRSITRYPLYKFFSSNVVESLLDECAIGYVDVRIHGVCSIARNEYNMSAGISNNV